MLKTIDIFIGLSLIMLLLSMIVTVITQAVTSILNSRGKHLLTGVADMLEQMHPGLTRNIALEIANAVLTHPLVSGTNGSLGSVIHREELTKLLLELGAQDGPQKLSAQALQALQTALVANGLCQGGTPDQISDQIRAKLQNIRTVALHLELANPGSSNAARARLAFLQQANSQFLAKINLWFDQTMDRASERFTAHARLVTFFAGLLLALALQLDTAALVSRLSSDNDLRQSLIELAQKQTPPPASSAPATAPPAPAPAPAAGGRAGANDQANPTPANDQKNTPPPADVQANTLGAGTTANGLLALGPVDYQNIRDLMLNNVIGIPQSLSDWTNRWSWNNCVMKTLGILLTSLLLSLGAPFWYGALQNLLRLRSALANKDDQQRNARQGVDQAALVPGAPDGALSTDERGDLAAVA